MAVPGLPARRRLLLTEHAFCVEQYLLVILFEKQKVKTMFLINLNLIMVKKKNACKGSLFHLVKSMDIPKKYSVK